MTKQRKTDNADNNVAGRRLSGDEARLWRHVTRDVDTMPGRRIEDPADPVPSKPPSNPHPKSGSRAAPRLPLATAERPIRRPVLPSLSPGDTPGLDRRTAMRLKRGQLPIEARLDLHGMTRIEAAHALDVFIADSRHGGRRAVLVITGKGTRDGGMGVLREAVPGWLNAGHNRAHILAYHPARPRDGGEGALYVLLRRQGR